MTNLELNYLNLGNMDFATLVLPADDSEIKEFFDKLNPMDSDCELQWVELEIDTKGRYNELSLSQLKELAEVDCLETFDKVYTAVEMFDKAMEKYNNGEFTIYDECENDHDLGYEIATQTDLFCGADEDSVLVRYFDYAKFGQDCRFEGSYTQYDFCTMVEIHN